VSREGSWNTLSCPPANARSNASPASLRKMPLCVRSTSDRGTRTVRTSDESYESPIIWVDVDGDGPRANVYGNHS